MDKIDRAMLLKMMDDDQDQETQNQAVDLAKKDENIEFWIQPDGYKYSWDNCARVIIEKKDKEKAAHISQRHMSRYSENIDAIRKMFPEYFND